MAIKRAEQAMTDTPKTPIDQAALAGQHSAILQEVATERSYIAHVGKTAASTALAGVTCLVGAGIIGAKVDDPRWAIPPAVVGTLLLGGAGTAAAIGTTLAHRNKERAGRAANIEQQIYSSGGRLPSGRNPYYTLASGDRLVPLGPLSERFSFPAPASDEPTR